MRVARLVDDVLEGRRVEVKELLVGEIRAWLASKVQMGDLVDSALFDEVSLCDLTVLTDLTADDIDQLAPSDIDQRLLPVIKEINPHFFRLREKLASLGHQLLAQQKHGIEVSNSPRSSDPSPA